MFVIHFVEFWSSLREKGSALFCPSQRKGKLENRQSCLFLLSPLSSLMGLGDGIRGMGEGKGFPLFEKVESFIIPRNWVFARKGDPSRACTATPTPSPPGSKLWRRRDASFGMQGRHERTMRISSFSARGQERLRCLFFQG